MALPKVKQVYFNDVRVWDDLPPISRGPLGFTDLVLAASAVRDYYPGHHDPEFAREQGAPDVFINTHFTLGLLHRVVEGWMGPEGFVRRMRFRMVAMNMPGDTVVGKGKVTRKYQQDGENLVDIDVWLENQRGVTTPAVFTVSLPVKKKPRSTKRR